MPGMFWLVIVTMKSGIATARRVVASQVGRTRTTDGAAAPRSSRPKTPCTAMTTRAAPSAPMTAHRRATATRTSHVTMTGAIAAGDATTARNGAPQSVSSTPASMALASGLGIASTSRSSGRTRPHSASNSPQTTKAPTAEANPPEGTVAAASSAAPGVDQAMVTGIRRRHEKSTQPSPIVTQSTSRPEAACSGSAPTARSPVSTTANELVKPTSPQTTPASTACAVEPGEPGEPDGPDGRVCDVTGGSGQVGARRERTAYAVVCGGAAGGNE